MKTSPTLCPCGSGKKYVDCCKIFHDGVHPQSALELMKSRYSAYAVGDVSYIMKMTHPKNPAYQENKEEWAKELTLFCDNTQLQKLQILEFIDGKDVAFVTFKAYLQQGGQDGFFVEKSRFEKINGQWLYLSGEYD